MDINRLKEFFYRKKNLAIPKNANSLNNHSGFNNSSNYNYINNSISSNNPNHVNCPSNQNGNNVQNPYIKGAEGRAEWNDRYMNMAKAVRNWQITCAIIFIFAFVQMLLIGKLATESKIKPYVVETNKGIPYAIKEVVGISAKDQLLINYAINQFVINAKTIIADTAAEKILLDKLYAYSSGNALTFLQDFYAKNNPFELASNHSISVSIINSLPISQNTWQVIWEETKRQSNDGSTIGTSRWVGQFTYEFAEVNPKQLTDNPFGIYINNIVWSQNQ